MSEITLKKKPAVPCPWCSASPQITHDPKTNDYSTLCLECGWMHPFAVSSAAHAIWMWNGAAAFIAEHRKADFEAGRMVEVNPLNGLPLSTFEDYLKRKGS